MSNPNGTAARLRAAFMAASTAPLAREIVKYGGEEYEVREPCVEVRTAILKAAKAGRGNVEESDTGALFVHAAVHCTYAPGTDDKVLDAALIPELLKGRTGIVDAVGGVALRLMNVSAEDVAKN